MGGTATVGSSHCSICTATLSARKAVRPHPNLLCESCQRQATPDDPSASLPRAITIAGVSGWEFTDQGRNVVARDAVGTETFTEFVERHYTDHGEPIQWFAPGPRSAPQRIRIEPADADVLARFFDQFHSGVYYQIEQHDGKILPPVVGPTRLHPEQVGLTAPPTFGATTVTTDPTQIHFTVATTESICVLDQDRAPPVPTTGTEHDRVARVRSLARAAPRVVDRNELHALLSSTDSAVRYGAVRALESIVSEEPMIGLSVLSEVRSLFTDEQPTRIFAVKSIAHIAECYPDAVAHLADEVQEQLGSGSELLDAAGTRYLMFIADTNPHAALSALPKLESVISDTPTRVGRQALATIGRIARSYPDAVRPIVPTLCDSLTTEDTRYRISGTTALGRVTSVYPAAATPIVPLVLDLLDVEEAELRGNAVGILGDIAQEYPTDVAPYTAEVAPLLTDTDSGVRSNATGTLARVAEIKPTRITPYVPRFTTLLDDEWTPCRVHACWALGYCQAIESRDALQAVQQNDPRSVVRKRAGWALAQL
ncbi:HEAT repeat domain-containing protein [Natronocalculus amylovorans]|uniref:HEAT repeat domain-containing protein n=1 Tax=Natronocalculus amylovorans TaxID=2917812 RepID=A0AAE3K9N6_9EURY|nr:HEAT repeat domain-containing protein [Natronocalculus amylovorans]MCL9816254.1 HEAT repeat domain-containing protein [Natronocalculus amylovorans]